MNLKVEVIIFLFNEHLKFIPIRKAIWCNYLDLLQLSQSLAQVWLLTPECWYFWKGKVDLIDLKWIEKFIFLDDKFLSNWITVF